MRLLQSALGTPLRTKLTRRSPDGGFFFFGVVAGMQERLACDLHRSTVPTKPTAPQIHQRAATISRSGSLGDVGAQLAASKNPVPRGRPKRCVHFHGAVGTVDDLDRAPEPFRHQGFANDLSFELIGGHCGLCTCRPDKGAGDMACQKDGASTKHPTTVSGKTFHTHDVSRSALCLHPSIKRSGLD